MEEHILYNNTRPSDTARNEPSGMMTTSTEGWIKYPYQKSVAFPGMCLAEAWGWTDVITMSEGILKIPITKAYNYATEGAIELGSYCVFHRITYVELETIGVGATDHVNLIYTLPFGPPTEDGTDIKGVSMIQAHVKPLINPTSNHSFQVFWKVKGYVYTNINEEWIDNINTIPTLIIDTYSNPNGNHTILSTEEQGWPIGTYKHTADYPYKKAPKTQRWFTYTLNKIPDGDGIYTIHGLKLGATAHANQNGTYVHSYVYADLDGVTIDLKNKCIKGIKWNNSKNGPSGDLTTEDPIYMTKASEKITIASHTAHDKIDHMDIDTNASFTVEYNSEKIIFKVACDSWSQGSASDPATVIRYIKPDNSSCTYTTVQTDVGS